MLCWPGDASPALALLSGLLSPVVYPFGDVKMPLFVPWVWEQTARLLVWS